MTNDVLPKQRYLTRWAMKSGATVDLVTESTAEEINAILQDGSMKTWQVTIHGVNDQGWPVLLSIVPADVALWIFTPHQALITRPSLSIS